MVFADFQFNCTSWKATYNCYHYFLDLFYGYYNITHSKVLIWKLKETSKSLFYHHFINLRFWWSILILITWIYCLEKRDATLLLRKKTIPCRWPSPPGRRPALCPSNRRDTHASVGPSSTGSRPARLSLPASGSRRCRSRAFSDTKPANDLITVALHPLSDGLPFSCVVLRIWETYFLTAHQQIDNQSDNYYDWIVIFIILYKLQSLTQDFHISPNVMWFTLLWNISLVLTVLFLNYFNHLIINIEYFMVSLTEDDE